MLPRCTRLKERRGVSSLKNMPAISLRLRSSMHDIMSPALLHPKRLIGKQREAVSKLLSALSAQGSQPFPRRFSRERTYYKNKYTTVKTAARFIRGYEISTAQSGEQRELGSLVKGGEIPLLNKRHLAHHIKRNA